MYESKFKLSSPLTVGIITTNRCNLNCIHCMNKSNMDEPDGLATKDIIKIISQCKKYKIPFIEFNGGEFFVRDDVEEILDFAIEQGLKIIITTNGTLISDEWIEKYRGKITLMRVSIDSHIEEKHNYFRGSDIAFQKTMGVIKKLRNADYPVTVLTTISRLNHKEISDLIKFLSDNNVNGLHTTFLLPAGRGENLNSDVLLPAENKEFLEELRELKQKYIGKSSLKILEESPQKCLLGGIKNTELVGLHKCGAAFTELIILDDGYVLPCASFISKREKYQYPDLNIKNRDFIDIYRESKLMKDVRNIGEVKGKCNKCEYLEQCGAGCRSAADIVYNDIYAEDPTCWLGEKND